MTISSLLPDLVSSYIQTRQARLEADKVVEELKSQEELLKKAIIAKYQEQELTSLGTTLGTVKMTTLTEPVAEDWPQVWEFIKENDAFELLHKRLTNTAVRERWEAGESIPGVGKTLVYKFSVSKS